MLLVAGEEPVQVDHDQRVVAEVADDLGGSAEARPLWAAGRHVRVHGE